MFPYDIAQMAFVGHDIYRRAGNQLNLRRVDKRHALQEQLKTDIRKITDKVYFSIHTVSSPVESIEDTFTYSLFIYLGESPAYGSEIYEKIDYAHDNYVKDIPF